MDVSSLPPEMQALFQKLIDENTALKKLKAAKYYLKVSPKSGTASLYGLRKFPVSFFPDEWRTILGMASDIEAFLETNKRELSTGRDDPRFLREEAPTTLATP